MSKQRCEATLPRAVIGYLVGVALLAAIDPAAMIIAGLDLEGDSVPRVTMLRFWLAFFFFGFVFLSSVLAVTAVPIWIVLHCRGWRRMHHAAVAGALLGFVLMFGRASLPRYEAIRSVHSTTSWQRLLPNLEASLEAAALACIATLIVWRIAYRKVTGTPPVEGA